MAKTVVTPKFLEPLSDAWFEWRIGSARQGATETATDSRPFINCVRDIKTHNAWEHYFLDEPKTWERFCKEVLRTESEFVDQVEIGVEVLEQAGHFGPIPEKQALEAAKLRANGGDRRSDSFQPCVTRLKYGTAEYYKARLERDHEDIYDRLQAGEYPSVRRAAIDAGIVRELTPLERAQKAWAKMTDEERVIFKDWIEQ